MGSFLVNQIGECLGFFSCLIITGLLLAVGLIVTWLLSDNNYVEIKVKNDIILGGLMMVWFVLLGRELLYSAVEFWVWEINLYRDHLPLKLLLASVVQLSLSLIIFFTLNKWSDANYDKLQRDKDGLLVAEKLKYDTRPDAVKFLVDKSAFFILPAILVGIISVVGLTVSAWWYFT